jgi:hypothetical protein
MPFPSRTMGPEVRAELWARGKVNLLPRAQIVRDGSSQRKQDPFNAGWPPCGMGAIPPSPGAP